MDKYRIVTTPRDGEVWYKVQKKETTIIVMDRFFYFKRKEKEYWVDATDYEYSTLEEAKKERDDLIYADNFQQEVVG
jgi:hypothetical protein